MPIDLTLNEVGLDASITGSVGFGVGVEVAAAEGLALAEGEAVVEGEALADADGVALAEALDVGLGAGGTALEG